MQWSRLKSKLESFLCNKLKGRVQIHATVYRKFHDGPSRVWITLDKREILSASDTAYAIKYEKLYQEIIKEKELKAIPYNRDWNIMLNSEERRELMKASDIAEAVMIKQNVFESYQLYESFIQYISLSIDEALKSENIFIQAYSMLDRRLGKRRLTEIHLSEYTHPLVCSFYQIRCQAEGIENPG